MNERLDKIIKADVINGETQQERDKRMTTEDGDDSAVRQRLASIYANNPAFSGINFLNVEDKLLVALNPSQENANNIKGNENNGTTVVPNNQSKEKNKMAAEDLMTNEFGNQGAAKSTVAPAASAPAAVELGEREKKFLEKNGISESELTAWAKDASKVNGFKSYLSNAEVSNLLTVKGTVANRVKEMASKEDINGVSMHYAITPNPVVGILAKLRVPGKDYSKLAGKFYKDGVTPKDPRENIKYRLESCFGYNPSTRQCDPSKVAGDPEVTAKWVDYIYQLVNDTSAIKESTFDENSMNMLHLNETQLNKFKDMGAAQALTVIKAKGSRVPFADDLFVVDPESLNNRAAVVGFEFSVNGQKRMATDLGGTKYWPKTAATEALFALGITVATSADGRVTFKISEGTDKEGKPVRKGSFVYKDGIQPACTPTAKAVKDDKRAWVKVKVSLPIELKYVGTNKEGKAVTKKFNIYGYVPVAATWEPISSFPAYVSLKGKTTTSTGTARKSAAAALNKVMTGTGDAMDNIQALISLGSNINVKELITKGTISTKLDDASVSNAMNKAQAAYKDNIKKAEENRKAAAEARKNKKA